MPIHDAALRYTICALNSGTALPQCAPDDYIENCPRSHLAGAACAYRGTRGPLGPRGLLPKGVTAIRSFVVEPMQYGGSPARDSARHPPPTGSKGINLSCRLYGSPLRAPIVEFYASAE